MRLNAIVSTIGLLAATAACLAVTPVPNSVRWVASNPLIPHDTWSGKEIRVKAVCNVQGANFQWTWDFGDGTPPVSGIVNNRYIIEAPHVYTGPVGTIYSATLTVQDTSTGETGSTKYFVQISDRTLPVEVNVAIDEGLWALHKAQVRTGAEGYWSVTGHASETAAAVNAFEVNGHTENGDPNNPYTETVARGMIRIFNTLSTQAIDMEPLGNPDSNGNGYGVRVNQGNEFYQGGIFIDAIIASGTPDALAPSGPLGSGANPGVRGRRYADIVQDMVDYYAWGQYDDVNYGGWRYGANQFPDNSACQWGAIGLIPAERNWGAIVPDFVKTANRNWLAYSQRSDGVYGYTGSAPLSGVPYGTTPAGLVQCAMDGVGRGDPLWDRAETFLRNNFGNPGGAGASLKKTYYGLFSFVKAMLLHDSNGDDIAEPIQFLQSTTAGVPPIDWYSAEVAKGDPTDGVARTLVNDQSANGSWPTFGWFDNYGFQTPWAILMLKGTLFEAGAPVAVAKANPNPAVAGQIVALDGSDSFHQDGTKLIDSWEWDLDNDGTYDVSGPFASVSFPVVGNYPIKLRVTDNNIPEKTAETTLTILVTIPPIAPTASAGGPYNFCPNVLPWFLDATASANPDDGISEPGQPGDSIVSYEWDLDGDGQFDDANGAQPDVSAFFTAAGPGNYLVQVRVTDNSALSFPSSGMGNLSDTDSAIVLVQEPGSSSCECIDDLAARPKPGKVQLTWDHIGAHHYNIYRGGTAGGPYLKIGTSTSTYSTYLDLTVVNGGTYYYVVRPANLLDEEECQSNEALARPRSR